MTVPMIDELIQLVGHPRRARGRDRDGPPRPAQRARPQPRAGPTTRSSPSSRAPRRSSRSPRCPRAAPATSSTTTAPRAPTSCPAASRSSCAWSPTRRTWSSSARSPRAPPARPRPRARARTPTRTPTPRSRSSCTATPPSPARASSPRRSTCRRSTATPSAAPSTSSRTTRSASPPTPTTPARRRWASDLAKGFDVPIIHVNADDVAACISAVRLAFAFRQEFGHDVLIDLIGYRRFGHNEADEPAYTQPEMYQVIKKHPPVRELFARQLIDGGVVTEQESTEMTDEVWAVLSEQHQPSSRSGSPPPRSVDHATGEYQLDRTPSPEVKTAVAARPPRRSSTRSCWPSPTASPSTPSWSSSSSSAARPCPRSERRGIVWAHAEALAFASLLTEGIPIRLTGQDTERGTFSQRHLVLHDPKTGQEHCAMQHLPGRAGADGAAQQPAVGDGLPRLRVRLLAGGPRDARAVGGPVRRLRQRRPGDHRPVHRLRAWPSGARPRA